MEDVIVWSDIYSLGIGEIDNQHKKFFEVARKFHTDVLNSEGEEAVEEALNFLKNYALKHFQSEEAFMNQYDYPRIEKHRQLHEEYIEKFDTLADEFNTSGSSQDLAEEVLAMTQNWLVDHILDEDSHYAKHVKPLLK